MAANQETATSPSPSETKNSQITAPTISLSKGGGAIRGMGEKFAANPVTGTGSMTVPIATSPGRAGFGPQLSLSYDSGAGNGPFGFGWNLSLPSITRKTDKGLPQYSDAQESDVFILSGAEDLVPEFEKDAAGNWVLKAGQPVIHDKPRTVNKVTYHVRRYRPRIEGLFARIEKWTNQSDPADTFWRSISKDNITTWYGRSENSRIADPADPTHIFSWLISESHDDKGNVIVYEYKAEDATDIDLAQANERNRERTANRYLKRIRYGNRKPYLPKLLETEQWPSPPDATVPDGSKEWFFEVLFDYGEHDLANPKPQDVAAWPVRLDPFSSYRAGFEVRTYRLCQRVLMFHHFDGEDGVGKDCLVRSTDFSYSYEQKPLDARNPIYSFLLSVTQSGYKRQGDIYLKRSLPPVDFEYTKPVVPDNIVHEVDAASLENLPIGLDGAAYQWTDLHGEGIPGILSEQAGAWFYKRNLSPINGKPGNGKPRNDLAPSEAKFAPMELVAIKPNLALAGGAQFMDLAGDGQPDLVVLDGPMPGFYEHDEAEGWQPFRSFRARLNRDLRDPNLKFVDLDGDGHADVLISEDAAFVWHPSLAEDGFGPARRVAQVLDEEKGPRLVFADGTQSIYLADLSGDGLTDLARIRNGEVCYWPNLGYGRFGAKVTMDSAPWFDNPEQFDQKRIRLADIDGSGTTDIIYLHRDGIRLYFNQSGNSWSNAQTLRVFPRVDDLVSIVPLDLLGNGTACLVWSSPLAGDGRRPMRYVNLMGSGQPGGQKPHLLIKTTNNLGAETVVTYAPSTQFYLRDKRDGKPWITRLPFPVHVVERVETYDHISRNRFVTRYAYHHGYFDGEEREFRGFGMVEQWDTEELAALTGDGTLPAATNLDAASHVPPVLTKTWFHTGVYVGREHVSDFFAGLGKGDGEYYRDPALRGDDALDPAAKALLLDDTVLPNGLSTDEEREACRALKGSMLRQEVYADDAGPGATAGQITRARTPYTVAEQNFTIRRLQPRAGNRHAVFFSHPREAITYHYERNPADPRVQHALTLEVDPFGNVLKSAEIGYGRRLDSTDVALLAEDRQKQRLIHITCTENTFTNSIVDQADGYRTPLPAETRTYELRRPEQEKSGNGPTDLYRLDDLLGHVKQSGDGRHDVDYEDIQFAKAKQAVVKDATEGKKYFRRLIEHVRTLYRPNDLGAAQNDPLALLPLGTLASLALPGESYKLAFTPGLLAQVFKRNGQPLLPNPASVLGGQAADRGGYLQGQSLKADGRFPNTDPDDHWWIPAGRVFFSPNSNDTAAQELVYAQGHFFLPHRTRNPFHTNAVRTESFVTYDAYDLLMVETRDALGNRVTVGERLPNGNLDPAKPGNDYRLLQPWRVMDPNRNRMEVVFDALGMVAGTAVMGKPSPAPVEGDSLTPFEADLTQADIDGFHAAADPHAPAVGLLQGATTRIVYDLDRFQRTQRANLQDPTKWLPPYAATLARETHFSDPLPPQGLKIQISFSYSDGFGREIQKKIQAEPEKVGGIVGPPRWVGSGWTIFNNKGKPVRQYEPFFSTHHEFQFGKKVGVSPILFYDPVERVVATLHPNSTYEKVVFDPWQQTTWDVNDTLHPPQKADDPPFDPKDDPDVGGYLGRLPHNEYLPTWYDLRTDAAKALQQWPDMDSAGQALPDNAKRRASEKNAALAAAFHANTPTVAHFDSLGRPFLTVAHNRVVCAGHDLDGSEDSFATRVELDIEGNQREVRDAIEQAGDKQGRIVMRYAYDLLGNRIHQLSMEAGGRWMLNDVVGKPIRTWDSRGHNFTTTYDALRRPVSQYAIGTTAESDQRTLNAANAVGLLVDKIEYGEGVVNAEALNLRTRIYRHSDSAGVATNARLNANGSPIEAYDFKGNLRRSSRQLISGYKAIPDWLQNPSLDAETFEGSTTYDALNRPLTATSPDGSVYRPTFNEANLLNTVDVNLRGAAAATPFVTNIDYDAKGQRQRIDYGNRASTFYDYDPLTFRLVHLRTLRNAVAFPSDCPQPPPDGWPGCQVQNLHYTYDPAGNITHIRDEAQQTIYFRNRRVEPSAAYTYDALYRLVEATGREHLGQVGGAPIPHSYNDVPRIGIDWSANDGNALGTYVEQYVYDAVGNFQAMQHSGSDPANPGWTRTYAYDEASLLEPAKQSNRLTSTTIGGTTETYSTNGDGYDAHGNMLHMPQLQIMQWDFKDQLQMTQRQAVNAADKDGVQRQGERTWYVYDAAGQRVRKVTELATGQFKDERIYLGGFEIYRRQGVNPLVRQTLHIMDDKQRIALVETKTTDVSVPASTLPEALIRYQFGNHLGSASLELDDNAQIISYEEYTPYGSTSYQAVRSQTETPKRYRYTGKERDEESGLYYHAARYYAVWLARWMTCDPIGVADGPCLYTYCSANPIRFHDPSGKSSAPLPGLITNNPKVGALWQQAVVETLGPRFKATSYKEVVAGFQSELSVRIAKNGPGSNKKAGTGINYARESYSAVRTRFGKLAEAAGIDLKGLQVHHEFDHLAKNPAGALDTTNLSFRKGNAGTKGSGHNFATEVNDAAEAGIKNPGQHVAADMRARGIEPDVPELAAPQASSAAPGKAPSLDPHAGKAATAESKLLKTGEELGDAAIKDVLPAKGQVIKPHSPSAPKAPKGKKIGGGTIGKVIAVGIAAYVYFDTGDVWAAAQTANPIPNATAAAMAETVSASSVSEGLFWDFADIATFGLTAYDRSQNEKYPGRQEAMNDFYSDPSVIMGIGGP